MRLIRCDIKIDVAAIVRWLALVAIACLYLHAERQQPSVNWTIPIDEPTPTTGEKTDSVSRPQPPTLRQD